MSIARAEGGARLAAPLGISVLWHAMIIGAVVAFRPPPPRAQPPMYRVSIVAAPPGPRREGIVTRAPAPPPPPKVAPTPPRAETPERAMPLPEKRPPPKKAPATPTVPPTTPPKPTPAPPATAGGGPTGDRGTDVATVQTQGVEFQDRAYLENIVRQIAKNFGDHRNTFSSAQVFFLIHRDGSVTGFRFLQQSNNYSFNLDAQGAVEAAGNSGSFGPLPSDFPDDVLPVIFSFDPKVVH